MFIDFSRGLYFGTSQNDIEDLQNGTDGELINTTFYYSASDTYKKKKKTIQHQIPIPEKRTDPKRLETDQVRPPNYYSA